MMRHRPTCLCMENNIYLQLGETGTSVRSQKEEHYPKSRNPMDRLRCTFPLSFMQHCSPKTEMPSKGIFPSFPRSSPSERPLTMLSPTAMDIPPQ
mmetsp:Transcript_88718/g.170060  ORF Transcript_88718/g.170060 Transcript_88718/m.170060 type:complete len:95 (-) Transcript_88718:1805-2089(-)